MTRKQRLEEVVSKLSDDEAVCVFLRGKTGLLYALTDEGLEGYRRAAAFELEIEQRPST